MLNIPLRITLIVSFIICLAGKASANDSDVVNCNRAWTVVVLGSSTAFGTGASTYDSSWLGKYTAYLLRKNSNNIVYNLGIPGFTTYQNLCPTGFIPPGGRPAPNSSFNITAALDIHPDAIIINMPSNDAANGYSIAEQQQNFERTMHLADSANVPVWVTTTQPRNNMNAAQIANLIAMRDWINTRFENKSVDFWSTVANGDGSIVTFYDFDDVHMNNAGHNVFYNRIKAETILDTLCIRTTPTLVADAGNDIDVILPTTNTNLDGSASFSSLGGVITNYQWQQLSAPAGSNAQIISPNSAISPLTNLTEGRYSFSLTVTDNSPAVKTDTLNVVVSSRILIEFGPDLTTSPDVNGNTWNSMAVTQTGSVLSNVVTTGNASTTIGLLVVSRIDGVFNVAGPGTNTGNTTGAIGDYPSTATSDFAFADPSATNGQWRITGLESTKQYSIKFWGTRSVVDDRIIQIKRADQSNWQEYNAAGNTNFSTSALFTFSGKTQMTFDIRVKAGGSAFGYISLIDITRTSPLIALNVPPSARANDVSVALPATTGTLDGSGSSDDDGNITNYQWNQTSGPSVAEIVNPMSAVTVVNNLVEGIYTFQLTVTDDSSATNTTNITLTVNSRVLFDLGPDPTAAPDESGKFWNNIVNGIEGVKVSNAVTTGNTLTGISLEIINRIDGTFNITGPGTNTGNTTGAVGDYPATATTDFAFSHPSATNGQWKIAGLDNTKQYTIKFWGTRSGISDQRYLQIKRVDETEYQQFDASNNSDFNNAAVFTFTAQTEMTFDIRVRDGDAFSYICVVDVKITNATVTCTPAVSIVANPATAICPGALVTFTATPVNGGTAPAYQWFNGLTAISGATGSTYTSSALANGDAISVVLTSNDVCAAGAIATSNTIIMNVNPALPVSVSIAANPGNIICDGTTVTFTATPTNGGSTPTYKWFKGATAIPGETGSSYTASSLINGNEISVVVTSDATPCATGSPATSNTITMTVNPNLPVSVNITANPGNIICAGTTVTFTATPTNGGATPAYQWFNGPSPILGVTGSTYTSSTLADGDQIRVLLASDAVCATGNPAVSNILAITVNPNLPVSVSIAVGTGATICQGSPVTFTASPVNGGDSPAYQWFNGASPVIGETASSYTTSSLINGDAIRVVLTSSATVCVTNNPASSNSLVITVNPNLPVSVSIAADAGNIICDGTNVTFTASPTNGGDNPTYQWFNGASPIIGETAGTYTSSTLVNGDLISVVLSSNVAPCATGNPATSNSISMIVNPLLPVSVGISANPGEVVCDGTSVTFTATAANGGDNPTYQWFKGASAITGETGSTYTSSSLINGDVISVVLTSDASPCPVNNPATSNTITMTVNPLLPVSVNLDSNPRNVICDGVTVVFTATPINGGSNPSYQWFNGANLIAGENASTYSSAALQNGDVISVIVTSSEVCAINNPAVSNPITITFTPILPVSVTIASDAGSSVCEGAQVTFTASPANAGVFPAYQWYNGGTPISGETSGTYVSSGLATGDAISVELTSSLAFCIVNNPATSNIIDIIVNPVLATSVSIVANPGNAICEGTTVTFTATPDNGGVNPTYQWFNGSNAIIGETANTYTSSTLTNGDAISVIMTSNENCTNPAASNIINLTVNPISPVGVSIAADPAGTVCEGTSLTFTATLVNGGNTPSFQWFNGINPIIGANADTYNSAALINGDLISVVLTSSATTCVTGNPATSNSVLVSTIPNLPVSVSIVANPGDIICEGTAVTFTATPANGGINPTFQWFNGPDPIAGETGATFTSATLSNGNAIYVVLASSETCTAGNTASSPVIAMTVNPVLPVSVSISADPGNNVCKSVPVTFTASGVNVDPNSTYQWFNGPDPIIGQTGITFTSAALLNGDAISVILTSDAAPCASGSPATSNTILMTVSQSLPVGVTITSDPAGAICSGTAVTFTATPTNGGNTPVYQWLNGADPIPGETGSTYTSSTLINGDAISVILTATDVPCATGNPAASNTITVFVAGTVPADVTITANPGEVICEGTAVTFTADPVNGGDNPTYQWFNGTNPIIGETGNSYTSSGLTNGDAISVVLTSNAACTTGNPATSNTIIISVSQALPVSVNISANPGNTVCTGTNVTFTAIPTNEGIDPTYQWFNGANPINGETGNTYTSAVLSDGDVISVLLTSNAAPCTTGNPAASNSITMSIGESLPVSVSIAANPGNIICNSQAVIFTATPTNGGIDPTYQWFNGANPIIGETGSTYTSSALVNGDVISVLLTSSAALCTTGNPATSNSITMTVSQNLPVSVIISANPGTNVCNGTSVTFTATPTNGGSNPAYQWFNGASAITGATGSTYTSATLVNGDVITVVVTSNAAPCATDNPAASNSLTMVVDQNLPVSVSIVANPGNTICSGTPVTFTASTSNGGNNPAYQWFNGANAINGETTNTYTSSTLVNGDAIKVVVTSNSTACISGNPATSNTIIISISQNLLISVNITAEQGNTICSGTAVTFTANPVNAGDNPTYQWFNGADPVNGETGSTFTSSTLANGDAIHAVLTANGIPCTTGSPATSNTIIMNVNEASVINVIISANTGNAICAGTSVTFTATPINGGSNPLYQWFNGASLISGETSSTYTSNDLAGGDAITVVLTSNAPCTTGSPAISNVITMVVSSNITPTITIEANPGNTLCAGAPVTFTATVSNGLLSPSYQWTKNSLPISGATQAVYTVSGLVDNDVIACILTAGTVCTPVVVVNSNNITVSIFPLLSKPGNISGPTNVCQLVGTSNYATYSIVAMPNVNTYTWSVPAGTSIVSGQGTTSIILNFTANYVPIDTIKVIAGGCTLSPASILTIRASLPALPGPITGPTNACPFAGQSTNAFYSIAPVATATTYTWTVPNGAAIVNGQGTTSIEVSYSTAFLYGSIKVVSNAGCGSSANRTLSVARLLPETPGAITGPTIPCLFIGTNVEVLYSIAEVPNATSYLWTVPANANIASGQGTAQLHVIFSNGFTGGLITVRSVSNCYTTSGSSLNITTIASQAPGPISGPQNACPFINTTDQATYKINSVADATSYIWEVPAGAIITSHPGGTGVNDTIITVSFDNNFVSGTTIAVRSSGCAVSSLRTLTVMRSTSNPAMPSTISGPLNTCSFVGTDIIATYTIAKVPNASFYNWTVPANAFASHPESGSNDTIILVTYNAAFTGGIISVSSANACGSNNKVRTLAVSSAGPITTPTITGPSNPCPFIGNEAATYVINKITNATGYAWTVPAIGATVVHPNPPGVNDTIILVTFTTDFTTGNITARADAACGNTGTRTLALVRKLSSAPSPITTTLLNSCPNREYRYSVSALPSNATSLAWTIPAGASIVSGQGTASITVSYPGTAIVSTLSVVGVNNCGNGTVTRTISINLPACSVPRPQTDLEVTVMPNPSYSEFKLTIVSHDIKTPIHLRIMDVNGRKIETQTIKFTEPMTFGGNYTKGVYFAEVIQGDKRKIIKLIKL